MSKEILAIIKKYKGFYFFALLLGISVTLYMYSTRPLQYMATGYFKYIPLSGVEKTTKTDKNGIITYEAFSLGEGDLDFSILNNSKDLSVEFNTSKGVYVVSSTSISPDSSVNAVNNFLNLAVAKNSEFLKEKIAYTNSFDEKQKLENLIKYPQKSFPEIVNAEKTDTIDKGHILLFFGIILSFFIATTVTILKKRVDEV